MKKVILLVLFMPFSAYGQILENFESGMLNNWVQSIEDRWKADSVGAVSGKYSLHHSYDNPGTGIDKIGLQVRNLHLSEGITRWTFQIRYGYDPSSSNNWALFLMSDSDPGTMSIDGGTNGYALGKTKIGNFRLTDGEDVKLYVKSGFPPYILIHSRNNKPIYINFEDSRKTIELYNDLMKNKNLK